MIGLYLIAFLLMASGIFILFQINPYDLLQNLPNLIPKKQVTMKNKIKRSLNPPKPRGIRKIIKESKDILKSSNKLGRFSSLCILSLLLLTLGFLIAGFMDNVFLMPVLAVGLALIPFLYIMLASFGYKKRLNAELETSLSIITAEYIRSENFIGAVQENIEYFHSPVKEIFQNFITQVTLINPDITEELNKLKYQIDNDVFHEWIDAVILCQNNRTLKHTLMPIVNKLSDMRVVSGDLNLQLYDPFKEFILTALFLILEPLFIRSQNADWFNILMTTTAGKIVLAVDTIAFFFCLIRIIRLTRPIEYQR